MMNIEHGIMNDEVYYECGVGNFLLNLLNVCNKSRTTQRFYKKFLINNPLKEELNKK